MKQIKPNNSYLGCWNCYVAAGKDKEERNKRLNEAPERLRGDVKRHTQTVFDLRKSKYLRLIEEGEGNDTASK